MTKKKRMKKIIKMGKFERLLYTFTILLLVLSPFAIVFSQATLSKINFDVEKVKKQITTQEKKNESLAMKVNELASLDNIKSIAQEQGLSYNNNNIKSISDSRE